MPGRQTMEGVTAGGNVKQLSNIETDQVMRQIVAAGDVQQLIEVASNNLDVIAAELQELISKLQKYDSNAIAEIERMDRAATAAKAGNSGEMLAALKGAGRWVVDFATGVGAELVAKILEKQVSL